MQRRRIPAQNQLNQATSSPSHVNDSPSRKRLQPQSRIRRRLKRHSQLKKRTKHIRKVLEKLVIILRIRLDILLETLILNQRHIRRQHHQTLRALILILLRALPCAEIPFALVEQQAEVVVCYDGGGMGPRAFEAGAVGVAAAEGVGAGESDDFLVVETLSRIYQHLVGGNLITFSTHHAAEDCAEVLLFFAAVREAS